MVRECATEGGVRSRMLPHGGVQGLPSVFTRWLGGDQPGFLFVLEAVVLALDVDRGRVVQQMVEDGRGDNVVSEN